MAYPFNDLVLNQDMDTDEQNNEEGPLYTDEDDEEGDEWKDKDAEEEEEEGQDGNENFE